LCRSRGDLGRGGRFRRGGRRVRRGWCGRGRGGRLSGGRGGRLRGGRRVGRERWRRRGFFAVRGRGGLLAGRGGGGARRAGGLAGDRWGRGQLRFLGRGGRGRRPVGAGRLQGEVRSGVRLLAGAAHYRGGRGENGRDRHPGGGEHDEPSRSGVGVLQLLHRLPLVDRSSNAP